MDKDQKGIWVASDYDIGYLKNIYQGQPNDWWITSDYYSSVYLLNAVIIVNGNVFLGGASGNVFVT